MLSGRAVSWLLLGLNGVWIGAYALIPTAETTQPRKEPAQPINFSRQILPLLSDRCFNCHGPDPSSRKANLRLDTAEGAFSKGDGAPAIVPGKPNESLVIKRITSANSPMPPHSFGKPLTKAEQALIRQWIAEGAKYGKLWSLEPLPKTVAVPKVKTEWPLDDLDRFIWQGLAKNGLSPSKPASPERWLRRVTLDLTGLPPTEQEIERFKKEKDYEQVVDGLLVSPRYGERMAVDWLDAARYADSYGYQSDLLMPTWPYRDWVVKAFNNNLPYDKFLADQIAGDLQPGATREQKLATAFNRLHRQSNEGGSIAEEFKTEYAVDRVSTFGTAFLGLTLGCARCHDHKYDPVSQKEFYQLYAYFNSIKEYGLVLTSDIVPTPSILLPTLQQEKKLISLRAQLKVAQQEHSSHAVSWRVSQDFYKWLETKPKVDVRAGLTAEFDLEQFTDKFADRSGRPPFGRKIGNPITVDGVKGKGLQLDGDSGLALKGLPARERWDPFTWSFWISDPRKSGPVVLLHRTGGTDVGLCGFDLMLENGYLTARVMRHWPGNALGIRSNIQVPKDKWTHIGWSYDGSGTANGLRLLVNGKLVETTVLADKLWKKINAHGDLGPSENEWSFGQRFRDAGFKGGKIDEISFANRDFTDGEIAQLYKASPMTRADLLYYYYNAVDPEVKESWDRVLKSHQALAEFESGIHEISTMEEADPPVPAFLLNRGEYNSPREKVSRGVPKALPSIKPGSTNRLDLAKWATQPNHPLTARVAVNRLWQKIFGVGIVETSDNFGVQGSQPSHPELLDFLARRFVNDGWDVKKTLKRIVLSAAYRQDSARPSAKQMAVDPQNRLLSRGPSGRLTGEMIRDTALAASGLLKEKVGGPPVNPYQPAGIWTENNAFTPGFVQSKGPDLYRRSLYSTWKRTTPVPSMMTFDATPREACTMKRPSTNTPMQALVLLNDVQFVEAARVLAERTLEQKGGIEFPFVRLSGRRPDKAETAVLELALQEQSALFKLDKAGAAKLIGVGDSKANPAMDPSELAAMTVVVQMILNSDAVIWKR